MLELVALGTVLGEALFASLRLPRPRGRERAAIQSRFCQVVMHTSLPSASAKVQKAGASAS